MKRNEYSNRKREKDPEEDEEAEAEEEGRDDAEVVVLRDPLELFGMDIMLSILSFLDARSGVLSLLVSHAWKSGTSSLPVIACGVPRLPQNTGETMILFGRALAIATM
ncbi:hypothetical protein ACLB2K_040734 [Fragaria x ananassa]